MCRSLNLLGRWLLSLTGVLILSACAQNELTQPSLSAGDRIIGYSGQRVGLYGYGHPISATEIAGWDIDIRPDGVGLPPGNGSVEQGEWLYEEQCAECHGSFGEGVGRYPVLAGGEGSLQDARPSKTVGSYWPYTTTLFDYIRRTMPFTQPQSLSDDETYALTAYVLYLNDLVDDDLVLNQHNLATITLPNQANFIPDPRPDVANIRCMSNCRDPAAIRIHSEVAPPPDPVVLTAQVQDQSSTPVHPGREHYELFCSVCHKQGVGGAPIPGNAAHWQARMQRGLPDLVSNAINGIVGDTGVMPAKGGFMQLTDAEVAAAVEYMLGERRD